MNETDAESLRSPDVKQRIEADGSKVLVSSPEALRKLIAAEIEKWSKVIKRVGIKPPPQ